MAILFCDEEGQVASTAIQQCGIAELRPLCTALPAILRAHGTSIRPEVELKAFWFGESTWLTVNSHLLPPTKSGALLVIVDADFRRHADLDPKNLAAFLYAFHHALVEKAQQAIALAASNAHPSNPGMGVQRPQNDVDVFISHCSQDTSLVTPVVTLIRSALNLPSERIRASSLDGFRLPAGIATADRLRFEVCQSKAFVAIITPNSMASVYVLFELGARWGAGMPILPLLAKGATTNDLRGPLSGLNALDCGKATQLQQFVREGCSSLLRVLKSLQTAANSTEGW